MATKLDRRQELLRAARAVFSEKGYHEAKIDDIVALAKVAKGTYYLYFRDKRAIFAELVDGLFTRLGGAILHVDPQADVESQIKHNIRAIVAVLLDDPALTSILLSYSAGLDPAFVDQVRSFHQSVKQLLAGSLTEGQRLGMVATGDPALYATFTIGALKEILFENALGKHPRPREEIVTALFDVLRRGYLRTTAGATDRPTHAEPTPAQPAGLAELALAAEPTAKEAASAAKKAAAKKTAAKAKSPASRPTKRAAASAARPASGTATKPPASATTQVAAALPAPSSATKRRLH
ncbi:TetR/AcrR family transcriptional regulator [Chondromyces crocatus]|uniref:HTH tetR-type domain-containing protein n=1 Tax=Chondromyces crocatus TaxID=52 RepID=A0A0K1EBR7_CHOCO|nr:TetR/AcrR family transcriptional regulator [Chondromyces crocatus]AKT38331.1 uncharacterized protein CMC5_024760 [Chondromyces crocatus]